MFRWDVQYTRAHAPFSYLSIFHIFCIFSYLSHTCLPFGTWTCTPPCHVFCVQSLALNTPLHRPIQYGNNHAPGSLSVMPVPPGGSTTYGLAFQRYCRRSFTGKGGRLLRLSMCGTLNLVWVLSYTTSFRLELSLGQSIKSWLHVCKFHKMLLRISDFTARWSTASIDA